MNPATLQTARLNALHRANEIRTHRARIKALIAEGKVPLSDVLLTDKDHMRTMRLRELLLSVPRLGPAKVHRCFKALRISPSVTLENFSFNRRHQVLNWLAEHHRSVRV